MLINIGIPVQVIGALGYICNSRGNWCSQRSEEVMRFPGTGVKGHCKPPDMGAGKGTGSPGGAVGAQNRPSSSLAQPACPLAAFVRSLTVMRKRGEKLGGEKWQNHWDLTSGSLTLRWPWVGRVGRLLVSTHCCLGYSQASLMGGQPHFARCHRFCGASPSRVATCHLKTRTVSSCFHCLWFDPAARQPWSFWNPNPDLLLTLAHLAQWLHEPST